jgi:hypothetical protein
MCATRQTGYLRDMIQLISAVAVALLTVVLGPILRGEVSGRLIKRISGHAGLREKLTGNAAALEELDELLVAELKVLNEKETYRLTRKLNGGSLAALIFVAVLGGAVVYGLVSAAIALIGTVIWFWVLIILAVLAGLFTIALAAVGLGTLYAPPRAASATATK